MQDNSVAETLRALAASAKGRPEIARLRELIDEIEAALSAGVSRTDIYKALQQHGFTLTQNGFATALYRIRKGRKASGYPVAKSKPSNNGLNSVNGGEAVADEKSGNSGLSRRERGRKVAEPYLEPPLISPLTQRVLDKAKLKKQQPEQNDEGSGD